MIFTFFCTNSPKHIQPFEKFMLYRHTQYLYPIRQLNSNSINYQLNDRHNYQTFHAQMPLNIHINTILCGKFLNKYSQNNRYRRRNHRSNRAPK